VAALLAHIAPPNNERLEICTDLILRTFVMIISLELTATATLENSRSGENGRLFGHPRKLPLPHALDTRAGKL
jgi:hypothetical protein